MDCFVLNFFNVKIYDLVWISAPVVSNHIEGEQIQINCIAIAKCDLYFHYHHVKEISFYHFCDTKLCVKHKCVCKCPFIFLGIMFVSRVISEQITSRSRWVPKIGTQIRTWNFQIPKITGKDSMCSKQLSWKKSKRNKLLTDM